MKPNPGSRTVAVVQSYVPDYRVPFFDELARQLGARDLDLEVWHGLPTDLEAAEGSASVGSWSRPINHRTSHLMGKTWSYAPIHRAARNTHTLIAPFASTSLDVFGLALDPSVRLFLWGHGMSYVTSTNALDERIKTWLARRAQHTFTYTPSGRDHLISRGVPGDKITAVMNSTDTAALKMHYSTAAPEELTRLIGKHGLDPQVTCLFVGAFKEAKRLPFLFSVADSVRNAIPGFKLVIAGDGPMRAEVLEESRKRPDYTEVLPRLSPKDLAHLAHTSRLMLMPGRVGLIAVDALAVGLPIVTCQFEFHSAEADYLTPTNSVSTPNSVQEYSSAIVALLNDQAQMDRMKAECIQDGHLYGVEQMARRFVDAIAPGK